MTVLSTPTSQSTSSSSSSSSNNKTMTKTMNMKVPYICQYWCYITNYIIPTYIPFQIYIYKTNINITFTIITAITLGILRYIIEYFILYTIFHWPYNTYTIKNAAASITAIIHSIQLVPSLIICFYTLPNIQSSYNPSQSYRTTITTTSTTTSGSSSNTSNGITIKQNGSNGKDITDTNTDSNSNSNTNNTIWWQDTVNALLQFCTGYMLCDALLNTIWMKLHMIGTISIEDYLFIGHHIATILYMTSTRIIQQGYQSAMICMLLGEITNPFHNLYYIAIAAQSLSCCNGILSQLLYHYIEIIFSLLYVLVRTIIAPIVLLHVTYNLWTIGRQIQTPKIHLVLVCIWTILIWGVVFGSIPWIQECIQIIHKYYIDPSSLYLSNLYTTTTNNNTITTIKTEL